MAGLFKSVLDAGKSAMDKYLNSSDPNLVKAVNPKDYAPVPVQVSTYIHIAYDIYLNRE